MSDCCANYFEMVDRSDSFETWAGRRGETGPMGPQGAPGRDGANVALRGPVATVDELPDTAPAGDLWLVGEASPYTGYFWNGESWVDAGAIAAGPGVPEGGLAGQYLVKNSDDSFDAGWRSPSNSDPLMDGTASPGTSTYLSRSNHRHPTDTSRAPLASPALTGTPTAPTPAANDNSTRLATTAFVQGKVADYPRPNLLDNWYFVGGGAGYDIYPVNQRGRTLYEGSGATNVFDRWVLQRGTAELLADGVRITYDGSGTGSSQFGFLRQTLSSKAALIGKPVTASALVNNTLIVNSWNAVTATSHSVTKEVDGYNFTIQINFTDAKPRVSLFTYAASPVHVIKAVKLEIGLTQTLAHNEGTAANPVWVIDEIPDYEEELAKAMAFFQIFRTQGLRPTYGADFRPPMATASPTLGTITIDSITYYTASSEP